MENARCEATQTLISATKKLRRFRDLHKLLIYTAGITPSVQSIIGATDTFLSKVSGLEAILKSGWLLIGAILRQIPANYTFEGFIVSGTLRLNDGSSGSVAAWNQGGLCNVIGAICQDRHVRTGGMDLPSC